MLWAGVDALHTCDKAHRHHLMISSIICTAPCSARLGARGGGAAPMLDGQLDGLLMHVQHTCALLMHFCCILYTVSVFTYIYCKICCDTCICTLQQTCMLTANSYDCR